MRRSYWRVAAAMAFVLGVGGAAVALAAGKGTPSYTGCLSSAGAISKVAAGDSPVGGSCPAGQTTIKLSGGDITAVTAGTGLSGGASNGPATLSLAPGYSLPQACGKGQQPAASGAGTWGCADAPQAFDVTLSITDPPSIGVATLPGGFSLRLTCQTPSGDGWAQVAARSVSVGDADIGFMTTGFGGGVADALVARYTLPAGAWQTVLDPGVTVVGQIVLHATTGAVTAVAFSLFVDTTANTCELAGTGTPGGQP